MKSLKIFSLLLVLIISVTSCTKNSLESKATKEEVKIEVSFDVLEQQSVANYVIEVSDDAAIYEQAGLILSDNKTETSYSITVSPRVTVGSNVFVRIKSVDIDGKTLVSPIQRVR